MDEIHLAESDLEQRIAGTVPVTPAGAVVVAATILSMARRYYGNGEFRENEVDLGVTLARATLDNAPPELRAPVEGGVS